MQARRFFWLCLPVCLALAVPMLAQEGHPLKGSWLGDWGVNRTQRTPVFMVLDWDGKNITGTINPGPDAIPIQKATVEFLQKAPPPSAAPARGAAAPANPPAQPAAGAQAAAGGQGGGGQAGGGGQGGGGGRGGQGGGQGGRGAQPPPPPPPDWLVHFEADGKDQAGRPAHIVIDGKIENLGLYNRYITGTWTQGTTKGDFKITRQ